MKSKQFNSIRFQFFLLSISSMVASALSIVLFQSLLIELGDLPASVVTQFEEQYAFFYFLVFLALAALYFFVFSRPVLQKIEKINTAVNSVKQGNLDIHIAIRGDDEIGSLAYNINDMVETLKNLREKEARSEQAKNEIISSISHDLRTPLTALTGYLNMVKSSLPAGADACQGYLEIAQGKCDTLKEQINELLEYSRVNFREAPLQKERIDVKEVVQQVMVDFVPQMESDGIDFDIQCEPGAIWVEADVPLLVRLLQNLLSNSLFYGRKGQRIDIQVLSTRSQAVMHIINYGDPIAEEDKPFVFERFYRGEKSRNANTGGKGMGLAIAKSIAESHAGQITFTSDAAQTVFTLLLPLALQ